jgi:flagellar basal-body rod protein FlgF
VALPLERLRHEGVNLFSSDALPEPDVTSRVQQGAVLGSNVQPILEMTRLIETQRAFESSARLIETHHDLVRRTIERQGPAA